VNGNWTLRYCTTIRTEIPLDVNMCSFEPPDDGFCINRNICRGLLKYNKVVKWSAFCWSLINSELWNVHGETNIKFRQIQLQQVALVVAHSSWRNLRKEHSTWQPIYPSLILLFWGHLWPDLEYQDSWTTSCTSWAVYTNISTSLSQWIYL
jgi:hypothetical protein